MSCCPTSQRLQQLLDQQLGEVEQAELAAHVAECSSCEHWLEKLAQDTNTAGWTPPPKPAPAAAGPDPAFLRRLKERLPLGLGGKTTVAAGPGEAAAPPNLPGYEIRGELGRGGMGIVYRAQDTKRGQEVALKTLKGIHPERLYLFKQEFRALADVAHPNLVSLYELISDGQQWAFTMALVEGVDFLTYVRWGGDIAETAETAIFSPSQSALATPPGSGAVSRLPWERFRTLVRQLAEGTYALHQAGKLHRDIKPSNVIVTQDGQVLLLDFGLIAELNPAGIYRDPEGRAIGTLTYMAPEQRAGQSVSPASDWYSVGVMLYEALTGRVPVHGENPPLPDDFAAEVPDDLKRLCVDLLRLEPAARPSGSNVLERLGGRRHVAEDNVFSPRRHPEPGQTLIGREYHFQVLTEALEKARQGQTVLVHLHGRSGTGKSTLLHCFLDELHSQRDLLILSGRCYEQESVPYKALDSLVDALGRYLESLPREQARSLLPDEVQALTQVFRVLRGVRSWAAAPSRPAEIPDQKELRRRAFAALRQLLTRLGQHQLLILAIDDLQWGDMDSAVLLADLLRPPHPPRLLLVGCYRSENVAASPFLKAFLDLGQAGDGQIEHRELALAPLSPAETETLVLNLVGQSDSTAQALAQTIVQETAGNPFFVHELVQHFHLGARQVEAATAVGKIRLEEVIQARVGQLPETARQVLETVAVCGRPLRQTLACQAAGLSGEDRGVLALLRARRFLRSTGAAEREEVETYHDRLRETVTAHLPAGARQQVHGRLAAVLEASGQADPELLAVHFQGALEVRKAERYYSLAAQQAAEALAFDRSGRLYQQALELHPAADDERRGLQRRLGEALANGGRGVEASQAYLAAAQGAAHRDKLDLQRRAAEQLLWCGRVDQGLDAARTVLGSIGMTLPRSAWEALLSILVQRTWLWLRGLKFRERAEADIAPDELLSIDTAWSVGVGLSHVDPIRGMAFHMRYLLLALRAGEPYRIARALGTELVHSACGGGRSRLRTEELTQTALALAQRVPHAHALGFVTFAMRVAAFLEGRWQDSRDLCRRSERILRERCKGVAWELHGASFYNIRALEFLGEWRELAQLLPMLLKDARDRGDLFAATNLQTRVAYLVHLMEDAPAKARQEWHEAVAAWANKGVHLQHYFQLMAHVDIAHYAGEVASAWEWIDRRWSALVRSLLLRVQSNYITMHHLRARSALAVAGLFAGRPRRIRQLLGSVQRDARRIERQNMDWSNPIAGLLRAGAACLGGQSEQALAHLAVAEDGFQAAGMALYAQVARRRRGQLLGGDEGRELVRQADAWMTAQNVRNPARIVTMYAPGFPDAS